MASPRQLTFVDAAALVAVLDRTAPGHFYMGELWRLEIDSRSTLVTTDSTVLKVALELQAEHGLAAVERFFSDVVPALRVERCRSADMDVAVTSLLASGNPSRDLVSHIEERVKRRLRVVSDLSGE